MRLRITLTYRGLDGLYRSIEREMDDFAVTNNSLQRFALEQLPRQATLLSLSLKVQQPTFDDLMLDAILGGYRAPCVSNGEVSR